MRRRDVESATAVTADESFEDMYRRELSPLTALGLSLTGDRELAVELVHEAMLRGYRAWPTVRQMDRPGAWVRRVLVNLATDRHRRRQRERRAMVRLEHEPAADGEVAPMSSDGHA